MERMILATGQISDAATLSGPAGAGDLVIGNLQRQSLQEIYRVIGSTATIDIDLGSAQPINTFALMGHSGSPQSYARITAGATVGATTYDSGDVPFRSHQSAYTGDMTAANILSFVKNLFFQFFAVQIYRYWRVTITDPGASYIDMGRLYVSNAFQPSYNMVYGMQQGFSDPSLQYDTTSGDIISLKRKKRRVVTFILQDLTEGEVYGKVFPLDSYIGTSTDVLFVPKPDDKTYLQFNAIYGKIDQLQPNSWDRFDTFSRQYTIKELVP